MVSALSFLQQYVIYGHDFLECNVAADETWVHHHSPEKKRANMEWKHRVPVIEKIQDGRICW